MWHNVGLTLLVFVATLLIVLLLMVCGECASAAGAVSGLRGRPPSQPPEEAWVHGRPEWPPVPLPLSRELGRPAPATVTAGPRHPGEGEDRTRLGSLTAGETQCSPAAVPWIASSAAGCPDFTRGLHSKVK
jgi:hypothetical protein